MASCEPIYTICATVTTGLEPGALEECREMFGLNIRGKKTRGKIFFELDSLKNVQQLLRLQSVDKYSVVVANLKHLLLNVSDKDVALEMFESLPCKLTWTSALDAWEAYYGKTRTSPQSHDSRGEHLEPGSLQTHAYSDIQPVTVQTEVKNLSDLCASVLEHGRTTCEEDRRTTFRVTCTRSGTNHCVSSMDVAKHFGSGIAVMFDWKVKLVDPDIEVLASITDDDCVVSIALTQDSRHIRNITHFGPTTLRSTIAYGLVRLAKPEPGEVVIDPMCGGGSISIEAAINWPLCCHLAGDMHELATPRTVANVEEVNKQRVECGSPSISVDAIQWDVTRLPLKSHSIDVVITDLPFGKKVGKKVDNWKLNPNALIELGRICKPNTGRAVLLTHDTKAMAQALKTNFHLWKKKWISWVNVGGLKTAVYELVRTKAIK